MNDPHILSAFDRDLEAIQAILMKMGGLVESAILDGATSLEKRDLDLAEAVRRGDKAIDELEEQVNEEATRVTRLLDDSAVTRHERWHAGDTESARPLPIGIDGVLHPA